MNKPITYSVVLTFLGNPKTVSKQLKAVPIAHRSNGSLVCMKGDHPWLDYVHVTSAELKCTYNYIVSESISIRYREYLSIGESDSESESESDEAVVDQFVRLVLARRVDFAADAIAKAKLQLI